MTALTRRQHWMMPLGARRLLTRLRQVGSWEDAARSRLNAKSVRYDPSRCFEALLAAKSKRRKYMASHIQNQSIRTIQFVYPSLLGCTSARGSFCLQLFVDSGAAREQPALVFESYPVRKLPRPCGVRLLAE